MTGAGGLDRTSRQMRCRWDARARRDAFHYVETTLFRGDVEGFFQLGEERVRLLLDPLLARLQLDAKQTLAVDLGCGLGRFSRAMAARFGRVLGCDVSSEMVLQARELNPARSHPNLFFAATDGLSIPLGDGESGFAFSYEVFQHMPSRQVIRANLNEVARVLGADGYGFIHLHSGARTPLLSRARLGRYMPSNIRSVLGLDPLAGDATFKGTPPLSRLEIRELCAAAGLTLTELLPDPTHEPGSRVFALVTPSRPR